MLRRVREQHEIKLQRETESRPKVTSPKGGDDGKVDRNSKRIEHIAKIEDDVDQVRSLSGLS
ncbi:unnamed protein product [Cylicostephanus goldi]|uniref:Uncharacterized protein n=1 Tax=Cylicostephanus goldi TaxID=71465 RepID=A0A3P6S387_CYLGO|nr:unnamed protein product [Cylicostephanus goldi]